VFSTYFEYHVYIIRKTILHIRRADKSLVQPGRKQANVSLRMARISFGALPCRKKSLMTARVSMLLKSRASLTCFRACFLPGRPKDLSAPLFFKVYFSARINGLPDDEHIMFETCRRHEELN